MVRLLIAVGATLLFQAGWLLHYCHAQSSNDTWTGCVSPNDPTEVVAIGKPTTICFVAGSGTNWAAGVTYLRFSFRPSADEYSRFHIPGSYSDLVVGGKSRNPPPLGGSITVHAESQLQLSFQRLYFDNSTNSIFPFLTAIINVKRGVVQGITWDNACIFCSQSECAENTYDFNGNLNTQSKIGQPTKGCSRTKEHCDGILAKNGIECDLILYVVWTGTDKSGSVLQSSANRFSAFPAQKLQDRISQNLPSFTNYRDL